MIEDESVTRAMIVAEAREWIGTRWHHGQAKKGVGADCIGLICGVAIAMGFREGEQFRKDVRFKGYGRTPDPLKLKQAVEEYLDPVGVPQMGDVVLLRFIKEPQHFAILSSNDYMIHAYAQARKVVENRIDSTWRSRIIAYYKFRGV